MDSSWMGQKWEGGAIQVGRQPGPNFEVRHELMVRTEHVDAT